MRSMVALHVCERCSRCAMTDSAHQEWQHWLGKMGWQGVLHFDSPRLSLDVIAFREDRAVGLCVPEEYGHILPRAYTEILDRIERGATHVRMPGTSAMLDTEWWRTVEGDRWRPAAETEG